MKRDARLMGAAAVGAQVLVFLILLATVGCGGGGGGGGNDEDLPSGVGNACATDGACAAGLVCQACADECTGTVRRCAGVADSSELISLEDGIYPGGCEDIAGPWSITETIDGGCNAEDEEDEFFIPLEGSGTETVDINQNGCSVSYRVSSELGNFSRSGAIVGSRVRFTGPFVVSGDGLDLDTNEAFIEGAVVGDRMTLRGFGEAEGTLEGIPITCEAMSSADAIRE